MFGKPSVLNLAASYGFGLVRNHPFIDGNKRAGFVGAVLCLELKGYQFQATEVEAALRTLALAASEMSEAAYAAWLKANSKRT